MTCSKQAEDARSVNNVDPDLLSANVVEMIPAGRVTMHNYEADWQLQQRLICNHLDYGCHREEAELFLELLVFKYTRGDPGSALIC